VCSSDLQALLAGAGAIVIPRAKVEVLQRLPRRMEIGLMARLDQFEPTGQPVWIEVRPRGRRAGGDLGAERLGDSPGAGPIRAGNLDADQERIRQPLEVVGMQPSDEGRLRDRDPGRSTEALILEVEQPVGEAATFAKVVRSRSWSRVGWR
jgi:hypothetical protein